ncbi:MAG: hypothetical protein JWN78_1092 [Bacteroidota bacterium]|nr:hypothetical protein [Bacteroidota bacterium]
MNLIHDYGCKFYYFSLIDFMSSLVPYLISVPLGAFSSLIAWYILNHLIKPKIKFSDWISKLYENNVPFYRFKFENNGKRNIVEVEITAKLRIKGLRFTNNWEVIYLPLDNNNIPIIYSIKSKNKILREVPRLELSIIEPRYYKFLSEVIVKRINSGNITLEELFSLGTHAELILIISGFDEISGARKTFCSEPYTLNRIKEGIFENNGLEIKG